MREWEKRRSRESRLLQNGEGLLRVRETKGQEKKKELTGYEFSRTQRDRTKEITRLENSYGSIAFGGAAKGEMTILVSEKRRHDQTNITGREQQLRESRQIREPLGGGWVYANSGSRREGAVAFQYHRGLSPRLMLEKIKGYTDRQGQRTLREMTPFLISEGDRRKRRQLADGARALRERREFGEAGKLEKEKVRFEAELLKKEQLERSLYQKLVSAVEELERRELFAPGDGWRRLLNRVAEAAALREDGAEPEPASDLEGPETGIGAGWEYPETRIGPGSENPETVAEPANRNLRADNPEGALGDSKKI